MATVRAHGGLPPPMLTPAERSLYARIAIHTRWANTSSAERRASTEHAREAFDRRFYKGIPEDLPQKERDRRAGHARELYFARLALKSVSARRARKRPS